MADRSTEIPYARYWMTGWREVLISALTGIAIALGQAPYSVFWISFPAICFALYFGISSSSPRQSLRRGLAIGVGFGALTFTWIVEPFLVDVASVGWLAPFALFFMATGVGLFWAAAFWVSRRMFPALTVSLGLALPVAWTAVEMLRSNILTGFPWALTSYIWIDTPVYQLASFVGPHGLTLLTLLMASGLTMALAAKLNLIAAMYLIVGAALWAGGAFLQGLQVETPAGSRPIVRLIQPNANQKQKWDPEFMPVFFERQLALTAEAEITPPDLVIWPEVAVPFLLNDPSAPLARISEAANGIPVVFGAQRLDDGQAYNSLAVLGLAGQVEQIYDKHHLVPFGEYLPVGALFDLIGLKSLTAQYGNGYSAGPGARVLDFGDLGTVLPLICYEAIFPHELRQVSKRPDWMLMLTNDAWFGQAAGPLQHLAQAKARAIELALPMVRVANTGVSAVIDARGQIVASMPLGVSGRLDERIPPALPPSLYWRYGDSFVVLALIVAIFSTIFFKDRNSFDRTSDRL